MSLARGCSGFNAGSTEADAPELESKGSTGKAFPFSLLTSATEGQMTVGTVFQLYSLQGQRAALKLCEQVTVISCCGAIRLVITLGR
jgi:hypothetical protein